MCHVKLILVDRSNRKMLMPPDFDTRVCDAKTEPVTAQLAILPPPDLCFNAVLNIASLTWQIRSHRFLI